MPKFYDVHDLCALRRLLYITGDTGYSVGMKGLALLKCQRGLLSQEPVPTLVLMQSTTQTNRSLKRKTSQHSSPDPTGHEAPWVPHTRPFMCEVVWGVLHAQPCPLLSTSPEGADQHSCTTKIFHKRL